MTLMDSLTVVSVSHDSNLELQFSSCWRIFSHLENTVENLPLPQAEVILQSDVGLLPMCGVAWRRGKTHLENKNGFLFSFIILMTRQVYLFMTVTEYHVKICDQPVDGRIPLHVKTEVNVHINVVLTVFLQIERLQLKLVCHNFPGIN